MKGLSELCVTTLLDKYVTVRDKMKLLDVVEQDPFVCAHYKAYSEPHVENRLSWTMQDYFFTWIECLSMFNQFPYAVDCTHISETEAWHVVTKKDGNLVGVRVHTVNYKWGLPGGREGILTDPIKPPDFCPHIANVDQYMDIVAPHCEALLELFIQLL